MLINVRLNKNFTTKFNQLSNEYGTEMARLNGFADEQLSWTDFLDNFVSKQTVADATIDSGKRYFCIDEITYAKNFQNLAEVLSDNFVSNYNARIILTGTDSLGLSLPSHSNLYDRAEFIHTTYMSFPEFSRIMNNNSIDFYMKHGNTLSEVNPFEDYNSANEYIETSVVSNMINSLHKSEGVRTYPPALTELYENGELENAIQRIINQYPQKIGPTVDNT